LQPPKASEKAELSLLLCSVASLWGGLAVTLFKQNTDGFTSASGFYFQDTLSPLAQPVWATILHLQ